MGRGKVELKQIEDKSRRQVSFSKRRNGLMKKAYELAVLCDVDLALFVFSRNNRLYEYSTGESMTNILTRYEDYKHADETVLKTVRENLAFENRDVWTADELTQMIQRHLEEQKVQQSDVNELSNLVKDIQSILQQVRNRKEQLIPGTVNALQGKQKKLCKENPFTVGEVYQDLPYANIKATHWNLEPNNSGCES